MSSGAPSGAEGRATSELESGPESRPTRRPPPGDSTASQRPSSRPPGLRAAPQRLGDPINPKHTFPNFVVGPSNQLAHAAAIASAGGGGPRYNPLFICGGTGLGKTHLVHAIAHRVLEERPDARIALRLGRALHERVHRGAAAPPMDEFRARYRRNCDVLLVDDIQFLAGREQTQEEFFHTFNALHDADKPIVVTSDKYPQQLQRMEERLVSRFTWGLVADIQMPAARDARRHRAQEGRARGHPARSTRSPCCSRRSIKSNVRELEGTLIRLAAKSSLLGRPIDSSSPRASSRMVNPRQAPT